MSAVSRHEPVRARMRERQRELARDAVLEGRDTGTRVCPDADVKVYLTASLAEARAARRASDLGVPPTRSSSRSPTATAATPRSSRRPRTPTVDTTGLDVTR